MKKPVRILLACIVFVCLLFIAGISLTVGWRPFLGPRMRETNNREFERTPERQARGRYLTQVVLGCGLCHSARDWNSHGAPVQPGMDLAGQPLPLPGFPGSLVAPNLTPDTETGAASWTDDQIARAIREGIKHDGTTLFPVMPYGEYRSVSDEDIAAVVVYLRSVPAVRNPLPKSKINFPVNYLVRSAPQPLTVAVVSPPGGDTLARGKYLAKIGCGCHSAVENLAFGGGEALAGPWGSVTSANITTDASGIGYYSESTFATALRTGYVGARKLNSIMPFGDFKDLTDDDLKAIFAYLRTVPPVHHRVDNSLPPTYCKICKKKHGAGDQN
jgi:mono/diheme cytochrome c family protein